MPEPDLNDQPIAPTSDPTDFTNMGPIAPPPLIITTSSGEQILLGADGTVKAKVNTDEKGTQWITFYEAGSEVQMQSEWGEIFLYEYLDNGGTVYLKNANGDIISTSNYVSGKLKSHISQGLITYAYNNEGEVISSTDVWGNITNFEGGKPRTVTTKDGEIIGTYNYGTGNRVDFLETFVDSYGNTTYFGSDGVRPESVKDSFGNLKQSFQYDAEEHLVAVYEHNQDGTPNTKTTVDAGKFVAVYDLVPVLDDETGLAQTDPQGNIIYNEVLTGIYNYDAQGNVSSITGIGEGGVVTGWTEYDDYGRVYGTYNAEGTLIQVYEYNDYGFLWRTASLGGTDPLTGEQAVLSYTIFDNKGRPFEVWQVGDNGDTIRAQEYIYKENGLMDYTISLGVERNENGEPIKVNGEFSYMVVSKTTFDDKGRTDAVYAYVRDGGGNLLDTDGKVLADQTDYANALCEKQQQYIYNSNGFLEYTRSYGFGQRLTGKTVFNEYSRPTETYNQSGSLTQTYEYNAEGFLERTDSYGENGTWTGWTQYDLRSRPVDVFNHQGSLVQRYDYDENGLLVKTYTLGRSDGVGETVISTFADLLNIAEQWEEEWGAEYIDTVDSSSSTTLTNAAWDAYTAGDMEKAFACALKCIQQYSTEALAQQADQSEGQTVLDDVGTSYYILGLSCEQQAEDQAGQGLGVQAESLKEMAIGAYSIAADKFSHAKVSAGGEVGADVMDKSLTRLGEEGLGADLPMITGFTVFSGDSRAMATYQYYEKIDENGVSLGPQLTKVQDYEYSYQTTIRVQDGVDEDGKTVYRTDTVTQYTSFVRKTVSYGDIDPETNEQVVTGYTVFDNYGRQYQSFNDEDQLTQKYVYSAAGFLKSTSNYGKNKAFTGSTVYDVYSRPLASFNMYGGVSNIPSDLLSALKDGFSVDETLGIDAFPEEWQPYLKGLTQTFEYGADGFLASSKSWGEATNISISRVVNFINVYDPDTTLVKGDGVYDAQYDYNYDGVINNEDVALFENAFAGITDFITSYGVNAEENPDTYAQYQHCDLDQDGDIDNVDIGNFAKSFSVRETFSPTYTGATSYDKFGKASEITNAQGYVVQKYTYNERGFMDKSESYALRLDVNNEVVLDGEGNPEQVVTGYTKFDVYSKPTETYSIYETYDAAGTLISHEEILSQGYEYDEGFLTRTTNYGDFEDGEQVIAGYTDFDRYGRQQTSYNEEGYRTAYFSYSSQGFLKQTYNYGYNNACVGFTVFDRSGRPLEAYNMSGNVKTGKGLTQTFHYNEYGFMDFSTSHGEGQAYTGSTHYDTYGKAIKAENDKGITVSEYSYNARGFLQRTNNLVFVEDAAGPEVENITGDTTNGYYQISGYTVFDAHSKPIETYQTYETTQETGALVQRFVYTNGFLTSMTNFGRDGEGSPTGYTTFDKYGRQDVSYNEYDERTTLYRYSSEGFLKEIYNYGERKSFLGKTVFNAIGRPTENLNQSGVVVQSFVYNDFSGQLVSSISYGEPDADTGAETITGQTTYNAFGKAIAQLNVEGALTADYTYDAYGFMLQANSYGEGQVLTGYTRYDASSRPLDAWSISEQGIAVKTQDFIYNTNVEKKATDVQYVGNSNTGFLSLTVNYGDNDKMIGYTTFNRYGQQEYSYNEYDEKTSRFYFSSKGFLQATYNYGLNGGYSGKTEFNSLGRPIHTLNERGYVVQKFEYSQNGFLSSTTSHATDEVQTATTYYNAFGKQTHTVNPEGMEVSRFAYNERGFLTISYNLTFEKNAAGTDAVGTETGWYRMSGYTEYDDASRAVAMYTVYEETDANGNITSRNDFKTQDFAYTIQTTDKDGNVSLVATGFIVESKSYALNRVTGSDVIPSHQETRIGLDGQDIIVNMASEIDTEIIASGKMTYDNYSRPSITYNKEGVKTSQNQYNSQGFLDKTVNYGENGGQLGTIVYNTLGRPTEMFNYKNFKTSEYSYDNLGMLTHTLGFSYDLVNGVEVITSRTEFDHYSKAARTYQLFTGAYTAPNGYQYVPAGTAGAESNYTDPNTFGSGALIQANEYNNFGQIMQTVSYGRTENMVSHITYDTFGNAQSVYNDKGQEVQRYTYSDQGFLSYTTSYQTMKAYDDNGTPLVDGEWDSSQTTRTKYDSNGNQDSTYLVVSGDQLGALQSKYLYNSAGFMDQTSNYGDNGRYSGKVMFDASGRQIEAYNSNGGLANKYWYDINGFLNRSTSHGG
ncbi:MAG: hypothetical protein KKB82_08070 [Candidatus Omnitrophica bacterium]|nr:hypothetical protein [Candidatus Omnitrophota bacterium]